MIDKQIKQTTSKSTNNTMDKIHITLGVLAALLYAGFAFEGFFITRFILMAILESFMVATYKWKLRILHDIHLFIQAIYYLHPYIILRDSFVKPRHSTEVPMTTLKESSIFWAIIFFIIVTARLFHTKRVLVSVSTDDRLDAMRNNMDVGPVYQSSCNTILNLTAVSFFAILAYVTTSPDLHKFCLYTAVFELVMVLAYFARKPSLIFIHYLYQAIFSIFPFTVVIIVTRFLQNPDSTLLIMNNWKNNCILEQLRTFVITGSIVVSCLLFFFWFLRMTSTQAFLTEVAVDQKILQRQKGQQYIHKLASKAYDTV